MQTYQKYPKKLLKFNPRTRNLAFQHSNMTGVKRKVEAGDVRVSKKIKQKTTQQPASLKSSKFKAVPQVIQVNEDSEASNDFDGFSDGSNDNASSMSDDGLKEKPIASPRPKSSGLKSSATKNPKACDEANRSQSSAKTGGTNALWIDSLRY
jgi:hypothetical protein